MFQAMASVFATKNLGLRMVEGEGDKNFGWRRQRIGFDVCTHTPIFDFNRRDSDCDLGSSARFSKGLIRPLPVASQKLKFSICDHLRRVRTGQMQAVGVSLLPKGEGVRRVGVFPSQIIPVIHMLAEDDQTEHLRRVGCCRGCEARRRREDNWSNLRR